MVSIDATRSKQLCKYVNDSHSHRNCTMKAFKDNAGIDRLGLFALPDMDIDAGMELRYSYGEKTEKTREEFTWRYTEEVYIFIYFFNILYSQY